MPEIPAASVPTIPALSEPRNPGFPLRPATPSIPGFADSRPVEAVPLSRNSYRSQTLTPTQNGVTINVSGQAVLFSMVNPVPDAANLLIYFDDNPDPIPFFAGAVTGTTILPNPVVCTFRGVANQTPGDITYATTDLTIPADTQFNTLQNAPRSMFIEGFAFSKIRIVDQVGSGATVNVATFAAPVRISVT